LSDPLIPRFWKMVWWEPYNNESEKVREWLYQYSRARDWVYRDSSKRFQISEETEYVNHPDDVLPELKYD
jgi:hypothetical protein